MREFFEGGDRGASQAYTSSMSLMDTMFAKGLLSRTEEGRSYRYRPLISADEMRSLVLSHVLETTFRGNVDELKAAVNALKPTKKK